MPTHAEIASRLLVDAATFFRTLGEQNELLKDQMDDNAKVFEQMAGLIVENPTGQIDEETSVGQLAGRLLGDAATFFQTLADQNEPIREQMSENARVYREIGERVAESPQGILE